MVTMWTAIAAVAGAIYTIAFIVSVRFLWKQWRVSAFVALLDRLQREEVRVARRHVLTHLKNKKLADWDRVDREHAETVCHTYDSAGIMAKLGLIDAEMLVEEWGDSLRRCWLVLGPFVQARATEYQWDTYWDDFAYLGQQALVRFGEPKPGPPESIIGRASAA